VNGPASEPTPPLTTERLLLRGVRPEDLDVYHARIFADPEVMRYLPGSQPLPRERLDGLVERSRGHWERHGYGVWVVCELSTGELIGQCGLRRLDEIPETEVLYALARPSWGMGLATEAAGAALEFGFDRAGLQRIVGFAVPDNVASCRVMEHLGMQLEGETRIFDLDVVRYAIGHDLFRPEGTAAPVQS
jgi:RimJ/RimL family protein N-acetyltransferase